VFFDFGASFTGHTEIERRRERVVARIQEAKRKFESATAR